MQLWGVAFTALSVAIPAQAAIIGTFTDRATFEAQFSSVTVEDFNGVTSQNNYSVTPFDAGDFTISASGNTFSTEVTPQSGLNFGGFNIDGTPQGSGGVDSPDGSILFTFDAPIFGFGSDFSSISDGRTTFLTLGAEQVAIPESGSGPNPANPFFGIVSDTAFTTISIDYGNAGDGFGFDNVTYNSIATTAVPEPMTILGTVAAFGFGAVFKKRQAKK